MFISWTTIHCSKQAIIDWQIQVANQLQCNSIPPQIYVKPFEIQILHRIIPFSMQHIFNSFNICSAKKRTRIPSESCILAYLVYKKESTNNIMYYHSYITCNCWPVTNSNIRNKKYFTSGYKSGQGRKIFFI